MPTSMLFFFAIVVGIPVIMGISVPDQRGGGPWACRVTTRRAKAPAAVRDIPFPSPHFASQVASTPR